MAEHEAQRYKVVLNHEQQYSLWWADRDNPPGWLDEGTEGTREQCLDHVDRVWTDMRPLSVRGAARIGGAP
ncbi:MbtH family protein [Actinocrinis puniceicyclus]|uniref:MbtH family protein n=1 Tax=Actinocrinis puniceicyclus TaxID=977794 RepID=A0A8J7WVK8_9ACTN|nr:MbtH family NRPS accessory protein [Actinocrinis puniceicyclus]MBS2965974.1 MbtH family protein [Actinocrinis puniceicyclus]